MPNTDPVRLYQTEKERRAASRSSEHARLLAEAKAQFDAQQGELKNSKQALHAMRGQAKMKKNQKKKKS